MPAPDVDAGPSGPDRHALPRRFVHDSEYRTSYIEAFQVRTPVALLARLTECAARENQSTTDVAIHFLEEAVRRRGG